MSGRNTLICNVLVVVTHNSAGGKGVGSYILSRSADPIRLLVFLTRLFVFSIAFL